MIYILNTANYLPTIKLVTSFKNLHLPPNDEPMRILCSFLAFFLFNIANGQARITLDDINKHV